MEMEDHHQQQYSMADLRQLMNGPRSTHFPSIPPQPTAELFPGHRNLTSAHHHHHYDMMMFGRQVSDILPRGLQDFATDSAAAAAAATNTGITVATTATTSASTPSLSGLEAETTGFLGGDASTGRWPRQETLTLLEIRSRLDPKFKEANQKGPLWDEVSRYNFLILTPPSYFSPNSYSSFCCFFNSITQVYFFFILNKVFNFEFVYYTIKESKPNSIPI